MFVIAVAWLGMLTGLTALLESCVIALSALALWVDSVAEKMEKSSTILAEKLYRKYH